MNIAAERSKADILAMGHNADDNAETSRSDLFNKEIEIHFFSLFIVMMNIFRGDINRLTRGGSSAEISERSTDNKDDKDNNNDNTKKKTIVPRCKPME